MDKSKNSVEPDLNQGEKAETASELHHKLIDGQMFKLPDITPALLAYAQEYSVVPNEYLHTLIENSKAVDMNFMQIPSIQASFLYLLAKMIHAKRILEIGCYLGYSTISLASALPPDGKITTIDRSKKWSALARKNFQKADVEEKIEFLLGEALVVLDSLQNSVPRPEFDMVFIDADKHNSLNYYKIAKGLLRTQGIMVIDNVLWRGNIINQKASSSRATALHNMNEYVSKDREVEIVLLPIFDGILLVRKK